jgi:hypothetical protein
MTTCTRCDTELTPESYYEDRPDECTYQFDNVLWIAFHGGYGMFVDNLDATLPNNTHARWRETNDGNDLVENPDWVPTYNEERICSGQPDYEAVLCHDCAHALVDAEPWIRKLFQPHNTHSHKTTWKAEHPEHYGWDYHRDES